MARAKNGVKDAAAVKKAAVAKNKENAKGKKKNTQKPLRQKPLHEKNQTKPANSKSVKKIPPRSTDTCVKCGKWEPRPRSGRSSNYLTCKACHLTWHFACLPKMFEKRYSSRRVAGLNWMCKSCSNAGRKKPTVKDKMAAKENQMMTEKDDDCRAATKIVKALAASDQNKQSPEVPVRAVIGSTEENKENEPIQQLQQPNTLAMPLSKQPPLKTWSVDQVFAYLHQCAPEYAGVFKYHEMDGVALMLLSLENIMKDFGLSLGPALVLYNKINLLKNAVNADDDD